MSRPASLSVAAAAGVAALVAALAPAAARGRGAGGQRQVGPPLGGPSWAQHPQLRRRGRSRGMMAPGTGNL